MSCHAFKQPFRIYLKSRLTTSIHHSGLTSFFFYQIAARILEAHSSLSKASLIESKTLYIRQWQALPEFGISHFIVKFSRADKISKREVSGRVFFLCCSNSVEFFTRNLVKAMNT